MKACNRCGEEKVKDGFSLYGYTLRSGEKTEKRRHVCKACKRKQINPEVRRAQQKRYLAKNKEKRREISERHREKKRFEYAIKRSWKRSLERGYAPCLASPEVVRDAFTGRCFACGVPEDDLSKRLCLDHDHATGAFRGWLCSDCNRALGFARDSAIILNGLTQYIEENGSGYRKYPLASPRTKGLQG